MHHGWQGAVYLTSAWQFVSYLKFVGSVNCYNALFQLSMRSHLRLHQWLASYIRTIILQQHILFNAYKRSACCHSFQWIHTQALLIRHCDIITVCEVQFALGGGGNVQQLLPE